MLKDGFVKYLVKLFGLFIVLYYGTYLFIGISAPGGYYSPFLDHYFNYVKLLRFAILYGCKLCMSLLGYKVYFPNSYIIKIIGGSSVQLVYSCLGYGLLSFWMAYMYAIEAGKKFKFIWLFLGLFIILLSNICRICTLLYASQNKWPKLFSLDHHTVYNIVSYILIIIMMVCVQFDLNKKIRKTN